MRSFLVNSEQRTRMKVEYVSQRGSSRKVLVGFEVDCVPGASVPGQAMTESSILAQNERWRRVLSMQVEREGQRCPESGGRVSNAWTTDPPVGDSRAKARIIPHETERGRPCSGKAPAGAPGDGSASHQLDGGVKAHRGDDG